MSMFRTGYYRRAEGEPLKEYIARVLPGVMLLLFILGFTTLVVLVFLVASGIEVPADLFPRVLGHGIIWSLPFFIGIYLR